MSCCNEYGNCCTQGRDCPLRNERVAQATKDRSLFWDVMEELAALGVLLGVIAIMGFLFGYLWGQT